MADELMKNKGGRPRGSSKHAKRDSTTLEKVADLLVKEPDLKATTAMRKVLVKEEGKHPSDSTIRRLQKKWSDTSDDRMSEAQKRRREVSSSTGSRSTLSSWDSMMDTLRRVQDRKHGIDQHRIGETVERARASVLRSARVGDTIGDSRMFGITEAIGSLSLRSAVREALEPLSVPISTASGFQEIAEEMVRQEKERRNAAGLVNEILREEEERRSTAASLADELRMRGLF